MELPVGAQRAARFGLKPDAIDASRYDIEIIGSHLPARRFRAHLARAEVVVPGYASKPLAIQPISRCFGAAPFTTVAQIGGAVLGDDHFRSALLAMVTRR